MLSKGITSCVHFMSCLYVVVFQLVPKLTRNFMKEGFMEKTGPKVCPLTSECLLLN